MDPSTLFLVWAAPTFGSSRSRLLARELGIEGPFYIYPRKKGGALTAPIRYASQGIRTLGLLFRKRPQTVLIQSPPSFAALFVYFYCVLTKSRYIVDAHSDAFQRAIWTRPQALYRFLARRAAATLVTDHYYQDRIQAWGARAFVLRDPVTFYPQGSYPLNGHFAVTLVNTFGMDEPLAVFLQAASQLEDVQFYVTGKKERADAQLLAQAPENVHFTDFLPEEQYYGLLRSSQAVMSLTTRDHTLQCGACEALSLEKPIITSDWPLLREYFPRGTVHVSNTCDGIRQGVEQVRRNYDRYLEEIADLHQQRRAEWESKIRELADLIQTPEKNRK